MKKYAAFVSLCNLLVLGLLLIAPLVVSGCGAGTSSKQKTINAGEFRLLQKARGEIGTMIQETSEALNPSLTLAQQRDKVTEVLEKHKGTMPDPQSFPTQPNMRSSVAAQRLQKTLEGQLNKLVRLQLVSPNRVSLGCMVHGTNGSQNSAEQVGYALVSAQLDSSAAYVSQLYQRAIGDLYGLQDFQKYVAEHTVAEGAKINPSNPPDQMQPNAQQGFQSDLSVNITYDPATGAIKYILGEHEPDYMLSNSTPAQIGNQFVLDARYWLTQGDDFLLDDANI